METEVLELTKNALWIVLLLSAPPIAAASIAGLLVAFVQAATQLQEQTFAYAVKFVVIIVTILLTASLLGGTLFNFTEYIFQDFPIIIGM